MNSSDKNPGYGSFISSEQAKSTPNIEVSGYHINIKSLSKNDAAIAKEFVSKYNDAINKVRKLEEEIPISERFKNKDFSDKYDEIVKGFNDFYKQHGFEDPYYMGIDESKSSTSGLAASLNQFVESKKK